MLRLCCLQLARPNQNLEVIASSKAGRTPSPVPSCPSVHPEDSPSGPAPPSGQVIAPSGDDATSRTVIDLRFVPPDIRHQRVPLPAPRDKPPTSRHCEVDPLPASQHVQVASLRVNAAWLPFWRPVRAQHPFIHLSQYPTDSFLGSARAPSHVCFLPSSTPSPSPATMSPAAPRRRS